MKIISRKEAVEKDLKVYFTGKPCKNGHISIRGINGDCKDCTKYWNSKSQYKNSWWRNNPEKYRASKGLPEPTREKPEVCEICKNPETSKHRTGKVQSLALDHNHSNGKFRGWLCGRCNRVLGLINDSESILSDMSKYLKDNEL